METTFDFSGDVVLVTGVSGALGSAVATAFDGAGATVCGADVVGPDSSDSLVTNPDRIDFFERDFTNEDAVAETIETIVDRHGGLDVLANIAGTWRGGSPVSETSLETFDTLFDVNLKTAFLASKHAIEPLATGDAKGAIVSVSSRSSLEGGTGDALYRASKAGVRLLTESIAAENRGSIRANAIMPSVIDTPMNREMMPDADHDTWVDPSTIAEVVLFLSSTAAEPTSGAAVPVYGEA